MTWSLWKINFAKTGEPGQFSSKLGGHPGFAVLGVAAILLE